MLSITHSIISEELHCTLFQQVAKVLAGFNLLNEETEYVNEIGLLCGGTEFQPVHFDVPANPDDKESYLEAMRLPNGPAIILLDFGETCRLGVPTTVVPEVVTIQRDTFLIGQYEVKEYSDEEETKMRVQNITLLQTSHGFIFRGDFKHTGAPLFEKSHVTQKIWEKAYECLKGHIMDPNRRNARNNKIVFDKLSEIDKIKEIMRLHVQILPKGFELKVRSEDVEVDTWVEPEAKKPGVGQET